MKQIIRTEGAIGLFRSLPITLIMNVPQAALFMTIYENLKSQLFHDREVSITGYFGCAGLAGAISSGITTPMDVIKTRLQTQSEKSSLISKEKTQELLKHSGCSKPECLAQEDKACVKPRYCTIRGTVRLILKEEGIMAFYRGLIPRMMFVLPGAAVSWTTYEYIKTLLTP